MITLVIGTHGASVNAQVAGVPQTRSAPQIRAFPKLVLRSGVMEAARVAELITALETKAVIESFVMPLVSEHPDVGRHAMETERPAVRGGDPLAAGNPAAHVPRTLGLPIRSPAPQDLSSLGRGRCEPVGFR